ncbi:MAG: alpha/beta fold hydrolase [Erysipelotrichia bacterium]|nr:alpha/beta fold hydrolase [Erysipelotrichia bacterium]
MKEKIYFIPGLMTDERLWKKVIPLLENDYEIVHVPIPRSEDFDEIIDILFNEIKEEKINLLGFSLGGYIASYFAITYPNRVKRVFMVAATPGATNEAEIERRKEKFAIIEKEGFGLSYEKALSLVEETNKNDEDLIQTIIDMFNDLGKNCFISQLTSTFYRKDLFEDLIHQDFPIWIFYSENDRLLNKEALKRLTTTTHNIKMIKREGSSHNIPLEAPFDFASNVKNWMDS